MYTDSVQLQKEIPNLNLGDCADICYACREAKKYVEDIRKSIDEARRLAEKRACYLYLDEYTESGEVFTIQTAHCSATPVIKLVPTVPMKKRYDEAAYVQIMDHLGVPEEVQDMEAVRINYEGFNEWYQKQMAEGKPVPPGINPEKTRNECSLSIRKKKDVIE